MTVRRLLFIAQEFDPIDSLKAEPEYRYWQPHYYDSIPVIQDIQASHHQPYGQIIGRYQSKDFAYVESISEKLNFIDDLVNRFGKFMESLFPNTNMDFNEVFYNLLAIVGGILFLFLIYKLFFSSKKIYIKLANEETDEEHITFIERNLLQVDLQHYIREALQKDNYSLAIRYQQLRNIQILQEKGYIDWKHTKTNLELMDDVTNGELKNEFLECSSIFDRAWFGNRTITEQEYEDIVQHFDHFQQKWA